MAENTTIGGADLLTALRQANTLRLPQFKNRKGKPAHTEADGSDWKLSAWGNAVGGEVGELQNAIKHLERGDLTEEEAMPKFRQEIADVAIYLDLLAFRLGIDLGAAIIETFNNKSIEVGSDVFIREGSH